jgi:hypothetical protein
MSYTHIHLYIYIYIHQTFVVIPGPDPCWPWQCQECNELLKAWKHLGQKSMVIQQQTNMQGPWVRHLEFLGYSLVDLQHWLLGFRAV